MNLKMCLILCYGEIAVQYSFVCVNIDGGISADMHTFKHPDRDAQKPTFFSSFLSISQTHADRRVHDL